MSRVKTGRSITVEILCPFTEEDQKISETSASASAGNTSVTKSQPEYLPNKVKEEEDINVKEEEAIKVKEEEAHCDEAKEENKATSIHMVSADKGVIQDNGRASFGGASIEVGNEVCTPNPTMIPQKGNLVTGSKKHQTAKKIAALVRNPSSMRTKNQLQSSQTKGIKASNVKSTAGTANFAQENQAIKRQKLDGGRSRQILNVKPQNLTHKSKLGLTTSNSNLCSSNTGKTRKEDRKIYIRDPPASAPAPFVSMAEMMKKFQSSTRDMSRPHANGSFSHMKPKLTLTRPKEPEFETSQRARSVRVKSTAELEEEMMAKIPKFKARPLNKKILQAPTLPALPRSTPQPPEFREFHLETMARAHQNAETASVASTEVSHLDTQLKPHLTEPKTPLLHTSLRARPPKVKSSLELQQEELEKIPKFKARPLNKKIFEIADLFDKLSLNSEPRHDNQIPKNTTPNPFHLHTEERGAEKEKKFVMDIIEKQLEEERARVPKANPYPYTTDYPVIPPKPEPKQWTKPEPFQLESLMRHEEEMQREMEERQRKEIEEAQMRVFKAQPILKEDPIPVPEKVRKPLTQVEQFNLHADHRAVDRAQFDQKIKEKEKVYKRYREESDAARMMEEEKALKQLRRTLVPHARPVPKFDRPFYPHKSVKQTTKAKSPNLRVLRREGRKTIAAVSSAAANMR
ncbi:protein TPX2 [Quillaja saponaria]|uniref:Protein TPX2 n=1 Tax=Quillaja saponaria TaxID=32244 RepID=A0AAD7KYL7_QUISA|nr:protein TPX2 [Quillaja saponaria]